MVLSIVRMQVGEEFVEAAGLPCVAPPGGLHGFDGVGVRDQRVEGKPPFGNGAHQHHAEGIGNGEAGGGEYGRGLVLDLGVDARSDNGVGGHGQLPWRRQPATLNAWATM